MTYNLTFPFSSAIFGLGMLHAFDIDHIMTISGLAGSRPEPKKMFSSSARWALGHGLILLAVGVGALTIGMVLPERMNELAETAVGFVLIGIGLWIFWDLSRKKLEGWISLFAQNGKKYISIIPTNGNFKFEQTSHQQNTLIIGMIHGLAGSAALLALIPLANQGSTWFGLAYLTIFSLGVLTSMTIFGGLFGIFFRKLNQGAFRVAIVFRVLIALSNLLLGIYWIHDGS